MLHVAWLCFTVITLVQPLLFLLSAPPILLLLLFHKHRVTLSRIPNSGCQAKPKRYPSCFRVGNSLQPSNLNALKHSFKLNHLDGADLYLFTFHTPVAPGGILPRANLSLPISRSRGGLCEFSRLSFFLFLVAAGLMFCVSRPCATTTVTADERVRLCAADRTGFRLFGDLQSLTRRRTTSVCFLRCRALCRDVTSTANYDNRATLHFSVIFSLEFPTRTHLH